MEINRDIMKKVNKVAHQLAQKEYAKHRDVLVTKCKTMLTDGKSRIDIDAYLTEIEAGGGSNFCAF
jgi:hypothetical protein